MRQHQTPRSPGTASLASFANGYRHTPPVTPDKGTFACAECGEAVLVLTKRHLRRHGLTRAEYIARHPEHRTPRHWPIPDRMVDTLAVR